jgi:hypothetical protein
MLKNVRVSGSVTNFSCQQARHRNWIHPSASYKFRLRGMPLRISEREFEAQFENLMTFTRKCLQLGVLWIKQTSTGCLSVYRASVKSYRT